MFSYRTMEKRAVLTLLLAAMAMASVDNRDLDNNMVAKMIIGFAGMMNLTSVMVCLPTPNSAEDLLPISVNVPLALKFIRK